MQTIKKWEENDNWVKVNLDLCVAAEECVDVCPVNVYEIIDGKVDASNIGNCIACIACQDACPNDAILEHHAWQ